MSKSKTFKIIVEYKKEQETRKCSDFPKLSQNRNSKSS